MAMLSPGVEASFDSLEVEPKRMEIQLPSIAHSPRRAQPPSSGVVPSSSGAASSRTPRRRKKLTPRCSEARRADSLVPFRHTGPRPFIVPLPHPTHPPHPNPPSPPPLLPSQARPLSAKDGRAADTGAAKQTHGAGRAARSGTYGDERAGALVAAQPFDQGRATH